MIMALFVIGSVIATVLVAGQGVLALWAHNNQRNRIEKLNRRLTIAYIVALVFLVTAIALMCVWLGTYAGKQREEPSTWNNIFMAFTICINLFHNQNASQYQSAKWPWDLQSVFVAGIVVLIAVVLGLMLLSVQIWRPPQQDSWFNLASWFNLHIHNQLNCGSIAISGLSLLLLFILPAGFAFYYHLHM